MSENWAGEKNLQFRTGNKIKMKYEINVSDLEYIKKVVIVSANESTKAQFEYELRNPQFQIQIGCIEQSNGCEVSKDSKKKNHLPLPFIVIRQPKIQYAEIYHIQFVVND